MNRNLAKQNKNCISEVFHDENWYTCEDYAGLNSRNEELN